MEWPRKLDSPLAWTSDDMVDEKTYIYKLTSHELIDVERALGSFKGEGFLRASMKCGA